MVPDLRTGVEEIMKRPPVGREALRKLPEKVALLLTRAGQEVSLFG